MDWAQVRWYGIHDSQGQAKVYGKIKHPRGNFAENDIYFVECDLFKQLYLIFIAFFNSFQVANWTLEAGHLLSTKPVQNTYF